MNVSDNTNTFPPKSEQKTAFIKCQTRGTIEIAHIVVQYLLGANV